MGKRKKDDRPKLTGFETSALEEAADVLDRLGRVYGCTFSCTRQKVRAGVLVDACPEVEIEAADLAATLRGIPDMVEVVDELPEKEC